MRKSFAILTLFLCVDSVLYAQIASDCNNATPICNNTPVNGGTIGYGIDDFNSATSSGCLERTQTGAIESNSAWYYFRTGSSGLLGFNIGHDPNEDWDFALYRASNCNSLGEPVRCNFFDNSEAKSYTGVGEDPSGNGDSLLFEDWLQVGAGEAYYILINNFSNSNSGFSIQFTGDIFLTDPYTALDCSVVNNLLGPPIAACEGDNIVLDATTGVATTYIWSVDYGSGGQVISGANEPTYTVPDSGFYSVQVVTPTGNIYSSVQVAFTEVPVANAVAGDIFCHSGDAYDLTLKDAEALGSQDPADYVVSYHSSEADAINGMNPLPKQYEKAVGIEIIYVRVSTLSNSGCFDASQFFALNAIENPILNLDREVSICDNNPVAIIGETLPNPNYTYMWSTGETTPTITVSTAASYTLTATNTAVGTSCNTVRTVNVSLSRSPRITAIEINEPQLRNTIRVITDIEGAFEYRLNDGDFQSSNVFEGIFPGSYIVTMRDLFGCGTVTQQIAVVGFLNHFSPNGDGINESWHIEGLSELNDAMVTIFDRYGAVMAQLSASSEGWDGNYKGIPLPATDYWFKLSYLDDNGVRTHAKYLQNHFSLRR